MISGGLADSLITKRDVVASLLVLPFVHIPPPFSITRLKFCSLLQWIPDVRSNILSYENWTKEWNAYKFGHFCYRQIGWLNNREDLTSGDLTSGMYCICKNKDDNWATKKGSCKQWILTWDLFCEAWRIFRDKHIKLFLLLSITFWVKIWQIARDCFWN